MGSVVASNVLGPDTYVVSVLVAGGQLVEPDAANAGKVKVATAASTKILGVAEYDAAPLGSISGTTSYGAVVIDMSTLQEEVAVAFVGTFKLKASGAIAFGDYVVSGALGVVVTAGATPAAGTVIGRCVEPAGIVSGALGLIRLAL
jgi:hypothetical protein